MVGEAPAPSSTVTAEQRQVIDATVSERFPEFERTQLLPLLLELQARLGHLSKGVLGYTSERIRLAFADLYGVASFYALLNTADQEVVKIRLCNSVPCLLAGAQQIAEALSLLPDVSWEWFPCLGQCDRAPAALVGEEAVCNLRPQDMSAFRV